MPHQKLKTMAGAGLAIGIVFISIGVYLFLNYPADSISGKLGIVFMTYSSVFFGIGITARIAMQT